MDRFSFPFSFSRPSEGGSSSSSGGGGGGGRGGQRAGPDPTLPQAQQQQQGVGAEAAAAPAAPLDPVQELKSRLLTGGGGAVPGLFEWFVGRLGAHAGYRCDEGVLERLRAGLWLCLTEGHSEEEPHIERVEGTVCGHVFAKSEIVYRCRTCGMDDTCVLCARCFNPGAHQDHDIFFSVSTGSGCCDCGDPEAWRRPLQCPHHPTHAPGEGAAPPPPSPSPSPSRSPSPSPSTSLEEASAQAVPEISAAARGTIEAVVQFVVRQLGSFTPPQAWRDDRTPEELLSSDPTGRSDLYAVLLYNDEQHSFDQVIAQLVGKVQCGEEEAKRMANAVDGAGRETVLVSGDLPRCLQACRGIMEVGLRCTVERLASVFDGALVAPLLEFCTHLAQVNTGYRRALSEGICLLEGRDARPRRLDRILTSDAGLWKSPRSALRDLIFSTILMDAAQFKEVLGTCFLRHYPSLVDYYLKHDPEPDCSLVSISLQLFTTPSVVYYLARHCSLISTILGTLKGFFAEAIPSDPSRLIDCEHSAFANDRYTAVIFDLKYVLTKPRIAAHITSSPAHLHEFLSFLELFQGMHPQEQALYRHVEYESQLWIRVFSLSMFITKTVPLFAASFALAGDRDQAQAQAQAQGQGAPLSLEWAITTTKEYIKHWQATRARELSTITTRFGTFQALRSPSAPSFHNTLHWFLGSLLRSGLASPAAAGLSLAPLLSSPPHDPSILWILEGPLKVLVTLAQVSAGLWRRNGLTMLNQAHQYRSFIMRDQAYDLDLLLLQTSAVVLGPDHIIAILLQRFGLAAWFTPRPRAPFDEAQSSLMAEELLALVIAMINERWIVGHVSNEEKLRTYFIQLLAAGPQLHSDLTKRMEAEMSELPEFDSILLQVATKRLAAGAEHETFVLKEEYFKYFDPYFFHFRRSDKEKGEEVLRERRRKAKSKEPFSPPPSPPLREPYRGLDEILHSRSLCQLIFYGIWLNFPGLGPKGEDGGRLQGYHQSDSVTDMCLHLIALALSHPPAPAQGRDSFVFNATELLFEADRGEVLSLVDLLVLVRRDPQLPPEEELRLDWCLGMLERLGDERTKEKLAGIVQPAEVQPEESEAEKKKRLAKERQEKIMREFADKQQKFALKNFDMELGSEEDQEEAMDVGQPLGSAFETEDCILCRTATDPSSERSFGLLGFVQPSAVLKDVHDPPGLLQPLMETGAYFGLDQELQPPRSFRTYQPSQQAPRYSGCHLSTCGHFMHTDCFEKFERMYTQKAGERRTFFFCPLCKGFGDCLIPVMSTRLRSFAAELTQPDSLAPLPTPSVLFSEQPQDAFGEWLRRLPGALAEQDSDPRAQQESAERERSNSSVFAKMKAMVSKLSNAPNSFSNLMSSSPPSSSTLSLSLSPPRDLFSPGSPSLAGPSHPRTSREDHQGGDPADPMDWSDTEEGAGRRSPPLGTSRPQSPVQALSPASAAAIQKLSRRLEFVFAGPVPARPGLSRPLLHHLDTYTYTLRSLEVSLRGKPAQEGLFFERAQKAEKLALFAHSNLIDSLVAAADPRLLARAVAWPSLRRVLAPLAQEGGSDPQDPAAAAPAATASSPSSAAAAGESPLLDDTVAALVRLFFVTPPAALEQAQSYIRLFFLVELTKLFLGLGVQGILPPLQSQGPFTEEEKLAAQLVNFVGRHAGRHEQAVDPALCLREVQARSLPFLRQASLLLGVHYNVKEERGEMRGVHRSEFEKLCEYLDIPSDLAQLYNPSDLTLSRLVSGWCRLWQPSDAAQAASPLPPVQNIALSGLLPKTLPIWLAPLELKYDSLLIQSYQSKCPKTGNIRSDPALCLVCGNRSCCQTSCCSENGKGPCTLHADACHGSSGLFLLDKQCVVLVLQEGKGVFQNAPYYDSHGETDPCLRRGKPLSLNQRRHQHLGDLWVSHKAHTLISQKMERSLNEGTWDVL